MKLARINTLLFVAIVLINGYVIVLPVLPKISFWAASRDNTQTNKLQQKITANPKSDSSKEQAVPTNQLVIPSMLLDEAVHEGKTAKTLRKGLWMRPQGSTPDKGGNTVIVGHRLTYSDPQGSLYHLDKVASGDIIGLWYKGHKYTYTVTQTKVVKADQIDIEAQTKDPQLTIYTCTPLWLPKDRLVVIAKPQEAL